MIISGFRPRTTACPSQSAVPSLPSGCGGANGGGGDSGGSGKCGYELISTLFSADSSICRKTTVYSLPLAHI